MSFVGTIQTGPNADSYRLQAPAIITVPASGALSTGTPVRRNITAIQGQVPQGPNFSAVVPGVVGGDQVLTMNAAGGGYTFGVYNGPTILNNTSGSTPIPTATGYVTRSGATPMLVGTTSGGTAVTVGSIVGMSSATGLSTGIVAQGAAAATNFATVIAQPTSNDGSFFGAVLGYPIFSAVGVSAVVAGSSVAFAPPNIYGWSSTQAIIVNPGLGNAETVTPSSINVGIAAQNNITFGNASATTPGITVIIGNASTGAVPFVPGGIISVSIAATTATTGANFATSVALALNSAFAALGAAPTNIPGVNGTQSFGIATAATSILSITGAFPSPVLNSIAISVPVSGVSSITSGGTSLGGTSVGAYPTVFATFANNHSAQEPIVGTVTTLGATITAVPQPGGSNVTLALVDVAGIL